MKILGPLSSGMDLGLAACAAVVLHGLALGVGFGSMARTPVPEITQVQKCESVSFLESRDHLREPMEEENRERIEKEQSLSAPDDWLPDRIPVDAPVPESHLKHPVQEEVRRTVREDRPKAFEDTRIREEAPGPGERYLKPPEATNQKEIAISRAAAPAKEDGFAFSYPRYARLHGYEGGVTMRLTISPTGKVTHADLVQSSGYDILDKSAMRQIRSVPFLPALDDAGVPVESTVIQSVDFNIENENGSPISRKLSDSDQ